MYGRITAENFYKTTITTPIQSGSASDTLEKSFEVSQAPTGQMGWLVVDFLGDKREIIFYHRVSGNTVYYYDYNRQHPEYQHEVGTIVQMNDVAQFVNWLSQNIDDIGTIIKKGNGLDILVYGGTILGKNGIVNIPDTEIYLNDNETSYIVLDFEDELIKNVNSIEPNYIPFARIVTSGGQIITIDKIKSSVRDYIKWSMIDKAGSKLNDIDDVDVTGVTDGKVLIYNGLGNKWQAGGTVTSEHFTDLIDTPGGYGGQGGKMIYVLPDESGVGFTDTIIIQGDDGNPYQLKVNSNGELELHDL